MSKRSRSTSAAAPAAPAPAAAAASPASLVLVESTPSDSSKRPRHFHAGSDSRQHQAQDDDEEKQIVVPDPSPIRRLHRHALESILGFCAKNGLSRALQVSKEWNAAVCSMKSISFWFNLDTSRQHLISLIKSPLVRHLGVLFSNGEEGRPPWAVGPPLIAQLAKRATALWSLRCTCGLPPAPMVLAFPRKLQRVDLTLTSRNTEQLLLLFAALNQLPLLEEVELWFDPTVPVSLNFDLLHPPALQSLSVRDTGRNLNLTEQQIDSFRAPFFANLDAMVLFGLDQDRLHYLFRTPHQLRWKEIAQLEHSEESAHDDAKILRSLAGTMSTLSLWPTVDLSFLPQLQCLTNLQLDVRDRRAWFMTAGAILAAFQCPSLTQLHLRAPLTSKDMATLLPRIPLLHELSLSDMSELESLSFLSKRAVAQRTLESLSLHCCRHPAFHTRELFHLSSLKALTNLELSKSFVEPLDEFGRALFTPPSLLFPLFEYFEYEP